MVHHVALLAAIASSGFECLGTLPQLAPSDGLLDVSCLYCDSRARFSVGCFLNIDVKCCSCLEEERRNRRVSEQAMDDTSLDCCLACRMPEGEKVVNWEG